MWDGVFFVCHWEVSITCFGVCLGGGDGSCGWGDVALTFVVVGVN